MSARCACCGGEVSYDIEAVILRRALPRRQAAILRLLSARSRRVPAEAIADAIYGDEADGGPDAGGDTIHTHIFHLKEALTDEPLEITSKRFDGYLLIKHAGDPVIPKESPKPPRLRAPEWQQDEDADLRKMWLSNPVKEIGEWLGRTPQAVNHRARYVLGLPSRRLADRQERSG